MRTQPEDFRLPVQVDRPQLLHLGAITLQKGPTTSMPKEKVLQIYEDY